jgi:hypothetical protein
MRSNTASPLSSQTMASPSTTHDRTGKASIASAARGKRSASSRPLRVIRRTLPRSYISIALIWKKGAREPPGCSAKARGSEKESFPRGLAFAVFLDVASVSLPSLLPARAALRQVFFPNRLLAGFPWLCADLYADTPLTRFLSAFGFLFSLLPF